MSASKGIKVEVTDLENGDHGEQVIEDDYVLVLSGRRYLGGVQTYANGTIVLTIKVRES